MANITLTVADPAVMTRIITALCATGNYQTTLPDGSANPLTAAQFAKQMLISYTKQQVLQYENVAAIQAAGATAIANVNSQIVIT